MFDTVCSVLDAVTNHTSPSLSQAVATYTKASGVILSGLPLKVRIIYVAGASKKFHGRTFQKYEIRNEQHVAQHIVVVRGESHFDQFIRRHITCSTQLAAHSI